MITQYIQNVMNKAKYEILEDDKTYYGFIPGFDGVWANAKTLEECRRELQEVLEEWILLKVRKMQFIPKVKSYNLNDLVCQN